MPVKIICVICGAEFSVIPSRVAKGAKYCDYTCHQIGEGRKGGEIRGEQIKQGLVDWGGSKPGRCVAAGRPFTGKSYPKVKGRHAHRIAAEKKLGRALLPGEVVHHDDENKQNYSEDNLIILPNQAAHARLHVAHMLAVRKPRKINKFPVKCEVCEKEFFVNKARLKTAKHCSRLCHNKVAGRKKSVQGIQ